MFSEGTEEGRASDYDFYKCQDFSDEDLMQKKEDKEARKQAKKKSTKKKKEKWGL